MSIIEGINGLLRQFSEEMPAAPLVQIVEKPNEQERNSTISKTIGEVLYRQFYINEQVEYLRENELYRARMERQAKAVAIHVLEIACPASPILAAMKAGMSFEEAVDFTAVQRADAGLNTPEPHPTDGQGPAIWDLVIADTDPRYVDLIADMRTRKAFGISKYKKPLRAHNGRNPMVDAYQESLDLVVYLRQAVEEGYPVVGVYKEALKCLPRNRANCSSMPRSESYGAE